MLNTIQEIVDLNLKSGDRVLLRLDYNVPTVLDENSEKIVNTFRIDQSLKTIELLSAQGCKTIIIAHKEEGEFEVIYNYLKTKVPSLKFENRKYDELEMNHDFELEDGETVLLQNVRSHVGEKKNDVDFSKKLSSFGDYYINEAFSASHRKHASIVGVPSILGAQKSALGPNFISEISNLEKALAPKRPMLLILGGSKFDTKLPLLEKFLTIADKIFVGGALAHNFWKSEAYKYDLGQSLIDSEVVLSTEVLKSEKILLPTDIINSKNESLNPEDVSGEEKIFDFGSKTLQKIMEEVAKANTVVWNGPLGYYEGGYDWGTRELILDLHKTTIQNPDKIVILGGGDTVTELDKIKDEKKIVDPSFEFSFTHVSTGGGAMIDFLSTGTLPGIEVLK